MPEAGGAAAAGEAAQLEARAADDLYSVRLPRIERKLSLLGDLLEGHRERQGRDFGNWGFVWDLDGANELLDGLISALSP